MTTKLYGGDERLFTAAEARRIDIERGGSGKIIDPHAYHKNWHLFFHEETQTWRICENPNGQLQHGIFDNSFSLVKVMWMPLTAFLNAEQSENPEKEHCEGCNVQGNLDQDGLCERCKYKGSNEEKIEQLEKENESLLAERNRLREWYEDYYTKQPTIEQLEKELAELKKERDNDVHYRLYSSMQKERDEYKNNYHEILADHGELTRKFDELEEKARKRECAHELPEREKRIYYFDTPGRLMGHGGYYPAIGCFVLNTLFACVELTDAQVKFWTWKYEADL